MLHAPSRLISLLSATLLAALLVVVPSPAQAAPLVGPCADLITFDSTNEGWRFATVRADMTVVRGPEAVGWNATQGNPGGALGTTDPDGNWSEVWTPPLAANGYDTDYSNLIDGTIQFDYRNDTGIGYNLYLAVWSSTGQRMYYNFRPQITNSQAWNRVRVPMDPTLWNTGFSNATGVNTSSPAPTASAFGAILSDVDRFVVSVEGRNGADTTFIDNFGGSCEDQGDAPATYGTTGGEAAAHTLVDYDETAGTAGLSLGARVDHEPAGQPGAGADGDDLTGVADEDGVADPIVVIGDVATTVAVDVTNDTTDPATLVGWVDLNRNGTFDTGERSALVTVPAASGATTQDVVLPAGAALAQDTYARFRLFSGAVANPLPTGPAVGGEVEDHVALAASDPGLSLLKEGVLDDANDNDVADVGETVTYTFTVTNTGDTPLTGVTVDDPRLPTGITPATQDLPFGAVRTFTGTYTVTQADIDAGSVLNTATASGDDPTGTPVDSLESTDEIPTPDRDPELSLVKTGTLDDTNDNDLADVGETASYAFEVENTGNVTITDVAITDPRVTGLTPATVTLAPGAVQTFSADPYVVTQADVNRGQVFNSATAGGTSPLGPISSPPSEERIDTPDPDPGLELEKTGALTTDVNGNGLADAGDTLTYTFEVENTGNVDLADVSVVDPRVPSTSPASQDVAAGATVTFSGTLVVSQADVDAGVVRNSATVEGTFEGPDGDVPVESPPSTFDLDTVPPVPGLEIEKSGALDDTNGNGVADVGETVAYTFLVSNTGNTTLVNIAVDDPRVTGLAPATATLLPGEDASFTADPYVVTQADVDAGVVANSATASGNVPNGPETTSPPDELDIDTVPPAPDLDIEKTASLRDTNSNGTADAGEQIVYSFVVTNTGNVTLTDVAVVDDRIAGLVPASIDTLAPGAVASFVADPYVVTAADVTGGGVTNVATAIGTAPGDSDPFESDPDEVVTTTTPPPAGGADGGGLLPSTGTALGWLSVLAALAAAGVGGSMLRRRTTGMHAG